MVCVKQNVIKSKEHQIGTYHQNKAALTAFDVIAVKYFVEFMMSWEMLVDKLKKLVIFRFLCFKGVLSLSVRL